MMTRRGQHNPMASQGPLDGRVSVAGDLATLNRKALEREIPFGDRVSLGVAAAVAYGTEVTGCVWTPAARPKPLGETSSRGRH